MPGRYHNFNTNPEDFKYIQTVGLGSKKDFSAIIGNYIPNFHLLDTGKVFVNQISNSGSYNNESEHISESFGMTREELFYYIYAVLHSTQYKEKYKNDLSKEIPRIPLLKNKQKYIEVGHKLADLHLNYEMVEPYSDVKVEATENPSFKVVKMKHPKKGILDKIVFNNDITISNIPEKAYKYVVNGKTAIQWIIEQYQVKNDSNSGIVDDPNMYSDDERYIFDLLLRIINVSVQTVDLVNSLPPLEIIDAE